MRPDSRFLSIGEAEEECVILHRSRRQHYNAVLFDSKGKIATSDLPTATAALWFRQACTEEEPGCQGECAEQRQH